MSFQGSHEALSSRREEQAVTVAFEDPLYSSESVDTRGWIDSQELYERARESYTNIIGLDIAFTTPSGELIIPRRSIEPLIGDAWFVGGRFFAGETVSDMVRRTIANDTNLAIDPSRVQFVALHNYYLVNTFPEEAAKRGLPTSHHAMGLTFTVELTEEEACTLQLTKNEYLDEIPARMPLTVAAESEDLPSPVRDIARDILVGPGANASAPFRTYVADGYEPPAHYEFSEEEEQEISSAMVLTEIRVVTRDERSSIRRLMPGEDPNQVAAELFDALGESMTNMRPPFMILTREIETEPREGGHKARVTRDAMVFTYLAQ